jgi:hypothetical protein
LVGATMASALKATLGQTIRVSALSTCVIECTSGSPWQSVPIRFHMKAIASRRSTSTPRFASSRMICAYSTRTSGLAQLTSHCHSLKVVQTHPSSSSSQVKLPGAKSGKTSGSVRS